MMKEIREFITANKDNMIGLLEKIVNIDIGSRHAKGIAEIVALLQGFLEENGITNRVIDTDSDNSILLEILNEEIDQAPIIFTGHLDTVFLEGTAAKNPFRIDEDGMMHGPGIDDMKSGIVIGLYTLLALKMIGYQERPIKFIMVTDEENLHMFSKAKDKIRQEAQGGLYALNFESGYLDDAIVVSRKGGGIVDIEVTGVAAHSGHDPEKGRSAILELAHKIIAIEALNDIPRGKLLNCGKIIGDTGDNVVSDKATISVGIRYDSMAMRQEILDDLKTIVARATIPDTETSLFLRMLIDPLEPHPSCANAL
ncbi:M20/M25/M40 family metallo-hydrolase [Streptococcus pluranimalium]|uniref:M20/M25/M40 family metallo-hydrolase n=1 Tax=Streptococcus pluranimalium TaxID=82348 RepID=UPI003F68D054